MKYMGSKNRLCKDIVPIIQSYIDNNNINNYLEPFVGGANVIDKIKCNNKYGSDSNKYLIALLKECTNSDFVLPYDISEEEYKYIKAHKEQYNDYFLGYIGFQLSYGAKWFDTFRRDKEGKRNYAHEAYRNVMKQIPNLKDIHFDCCDFRNINPNISNFVIYCDPPYRDTAKYSVGEFPYEEFYNWCKDMAKNNIVLISEYNMPSDFECIYQKDYKCLMYSNKKVNDNKNKRIEKLFICKGE